MAPQLTYSVVKRGRLPLSSGTPKAVHSHCFSAGPGKTGAKQSGRQGSEKFQTGREAKLSAYAKKILKALKKNFEEWFMSSERLQDIKTTCKTHLHFYNFTVSYPIKHQWIKLKVTETNGNMPRVHGIELAPLTCAHHPKSPRFRATLPKSQSHFQSKKRNPHNHKHKHPNRDKNLKQEEQKLRCHTFQFNNNNNKNSLQA